MAVESFIEDPRSGEQTAYRRYNMVGSGHIYTSYPSEKMGEFTAFVVGCTGVDTADVFEIPDGNSLELGFSRQALPEGAVKTEVTTDAPFRKDIFAPSGEEGLLVVRSI
jgi:hypothetical protein